MSDEPREPPSRLGNRTMQIDAYRDQLEVLEGDAVAPSLPPPLPPRSSAAPHSMGPPSAPPDAAPQSRVVLIGASIFVAVLAVGAALWVASFFSEPDAPPATTAPAMELGPIEIDLSTPAEE